MKFHELDIIIDKVEQNMICRSQAYHFLKIPKASLASFRRRTSYVPNKR